VRDVPVAGRAPTTGGCMIPPAKRPSRSRQFSHGLESPGLGTLHFFNHVNDQLTLQDAPRKGITRHPPPEIGDEDSSRIPGRIGNNGPNRGMNTLGWAQDNRWKGPRWASKRPVPGVHSELRTLRFLGGHRPLERMAAKASHSAFKGLACSRGASAPPKEYDPKTYPRRVCNAGAG
jgi:hypothetical protein